VLDIGYNAAVWGEGVVSIENINSTGFFSQLRSVDYEEYEEKGAATRKLKAAAGCGFSVRSVAWR
jgi:hypothetical protein